SMANRFNVVQRPPFLLENRVIFIQIDVTMNHFESFEDPAGRFTRPDFARASTAQRLRQPVARNRFRIELECKCHLRSPGRTPAGCRAAPTLLAWIDWNDTKRLHAATFSLEFRARHKKRRLVLRMGQIVPDTVRARGDWRIANRACRAQRSFYFTGAEMNCALPPEFGELGRTIR